MNSIVDENINDTPKINTNFLDNLDNDISDIYENIIHYNPLL